MNRRGFFSAVVGAFAAMRMPWKPDITKATNPFWAARPAPHPNLGAIVAASWEKVVRETIGP